MKKLVLDRPWTLILAALAVVLVVAIVKGRSQPHEVKAAFTAGVSLASGLDVQVDGVDVGKITKVEQQDGLAIVTIGIKDEEVWPLRQGTTAALRFGTTIGNGTRLVALEPGPKTAPPIPEGGVISRKHTRTPVEFDQVFNTLDARTRRRLRSMLAGTSTALRGHEKGLQAGLRNAPSALQTTGDLIGDLLSDETALKGLVANTDRVTRTLGGRQQVISDLLTVAASTFQAFGQRTANVQASLDRLAPTLQDVDATLDRSDSSLDKVDKAFQELEPGARELPSLARTANRALVRLEDVAPVAVKTLTTARDVAPRLRSLLDTGSPLMHPGTRALTTASPMLDCVLPYTPDVVGFFTNWPSAGKNYDRLHHYARVYVREGVSSLNGLLPNSEAVIGANSLGFDYRYAMPRPPGLNDGKPYFLPKCGITKDSLDVTKDPERPR